MDHRPSIAIRFDRTEDKCPQSLISYRECFELIVRAGLRAQFKLFVESKGLQTYFGDLIGEVLPLIFNPAFLDYAPLRSLGIVGASRPRIEARPVVVGILGEARLEKGFNLVPMILDHLLAKHGDDVKFEVQINSGPLNTDPRLELTRVDLRRYAERYRNVRLHEYLSDGEYYEIFSSVDVLLLPYDREQYAIRGSGLASESLAAGCAVVTSFGIDIAGTLVGGGVVEPRDFTEASLLEACDYAIANAAMLQEKTAQYVRENPNAVVTERSFVELLTANAVGNLVPKRRLALWISNDTEGQGSGVVYNCQLDFLKADGWLVIKIPIPYPAEWVLDQQLHFDWAVFASTLMQRASFRDSSRMRELVREVKKLGNSYSRFQEAWANLVLPDALADYLRTQVFQLAIVNYAHHANVIRTLGLKVDGPVVVETHDIQARQYAIQQGRPDDQLEVTTELQATVKFDHVVSISAAEASDFVSYADNSKVSWILPFSPIEIQIEATGRPPVSSADIESHIDEWTVEDAWTALRDGFVGEEFDILLVGSEHDANVQSMRWFLYNVYQPFLYKEKLRLRIVGDVTTKLDTEFLADRIEYLPRVPRLDPHYDNARLVALPIIAGAGVPIKVLDAFARAKPFSLMAFSAKALGLPAEFPVCQSASAMAADIVRLLGDADLRNDRAELGRRFYNENASRTVYIAKWRDVIDRAHEAYKSRKSEPSGC